MVVVQRRWSRGLVLVATAVAASVLVLLGLAALGLYHLFGLRSAVAEVGAQIQAEDADAVAAALRDLQLHSAGVGRWLGGAPWTWLEWVPWAGDVLSATVEVSSAVDAVATPLAGGLADVAAAAEDGTAPALAVLEYQADALIAAGNEAVHSAASVAAIDAAALPSLVADAMVEAQEQFADLVQLATGSAAGAVLIPGLLGSDGPTPWLLVSSQPAEARGSGGGFFGAVVSMEGAGGAARLVAVHPNDEFYDVAADLSQLPPEFAELWGESAAFVWGHNLTRHFPYAAPLLRETAATVAPPARYIVAVDPGVVAAVLELTGPVSAAGVTIDAKTAEDYLTRGIYQDFPEGDEKDSVASQLLAAAFEQLQSADYALIELAGALAEPVRHQRLVVWAADPAEQEILAWTPLSGALPADELHLTAAINNAAGNKLDAYLDSNVAMTVTGECTGAMQGSVAVTLHLDEVPVGLPDYVVSGVRGPEVYGGTRELVHVYGPPGARLLSFRVDGMPRLPVAGIELDRPVWGASLDLLPGVPRTVEVRFTGEWPNTDAEYVAQAMLRPTRVAVQDLRTCHRTS